MNRKSTFLALLCAACSLSFIPVVAHADEHPNATVFVCPATISIGAIGDKASAGWTSLSSTSASFKKAEVIESVGLAAPELTCEYATGPIDSGTRLGRAEPVGMLCTVNTTKSAQFDCFPRPGAPTVPSSPGTH